LVCFGIAVGEAHDVGNEEHRYGGEEQENYTGNRFSPQNEKCRKNSRSYPQYPQAATACVVKPAHPYGEGRDKHYQLEDYSQDPERDQGQQKLEKEGNDLEGPEFHAARAAMEFRIPDPAKGEALERGQRERMA